MDDGGMETTILYPTGGLAIGCANECRDIVAAIVGRALRKRFANTSSLSKLFPKEHQKACCTRCNCA